MCLNVGFCRLGCLRSCKRRAFRATVRLLSEGTRIFTGNLQLKRLQSQVHSADSHHFLLALWSSQLRFPQRTLERLVWGTCAAHCGAESAQCRQHTLKPRSFKGMVRCEHIDMIVVLDARPEKIKSPQAPLAAPDERNYGFGMDALVIVCFRNTNVIMILAWMLW